MSSGQNTANYIDYKDFTQRYKFIRKARDNTLGDVSLLKDTAYNKTVIAKEKLISSQDELDKEIREHEILSKLNDCPYIIKVFEYTYKIVQNGHKKNWVLTTLREYCEYDLEREIGNKLRNKDVFTEEEIWKLIQQTVAAHSRLQYYNLTHDDIRPKTILYTKESDFKVLYTYNQISAYQQIIQSKATAEKFYLPPELLAALYENRSNPDYNHLAANVFSLGMTVLLVCTLNDVDDCYRWDDMSIELGKLTLKLNWVRNSYSERIYKVLERMLQVDAEKRVAFWNLEELINSNTNSSFQRKGSKNLDISASTTPQKMRPSRSTNQLLNTTTNKKIGIDSEQTPETYNIISNTSSSKRVGVSGNGMSSTPNSVKNTNSSKVTISPNRSMNKSHVSVKDEYGPLEISTLTPNKTMSAAKSNENIKTNTQVLKEMEMDILIDNDSGQHKPGIIVKYYSDGSRYEGQLKGKFREGRGIYYYKNHDIYAGEWKGDKFHGKGFYLFANDERYEGELQQGMKSGFGVYYYMNKNKYVGEWRNDRKNGKGTFYFHSTNERYEGDWQDGERHGLGTFFFATGDKYVGNWLRGEKNGRGIISYNNGAQFEGEWRSNKPNGRGVMRYANGDVYDGNWMNGVKCGLGIYMYNDGSKFEGEWENDDKEGTGTFYHSKGDKYTGEWKAGLKSGKGVYYYKDGGLYDGEWMNDLKSGWGALVLADGTKYEGEWINGERSGRGVVKLPNGDLYEGDFKGDMMHGKGVYRWANGDVYQGEWSKNMMHGEGKFCYKTGETYEGIWNQQKLMTLKNKSAIAH